MPNYDFKCDTCGETLEKLFLTAPAPYRIEHHTLGGDCKGVMVRQLGKYQFMLK